MSKIIMSFTRKPCQITELNQLEYMLMEQVVGRKFLLVLDDVWSERKDLWDALLSAMSTAHLGVILVTTRNINVSSVIQQCLPTMWAAYLLMNLGSYLSSWPFVTKIKI
jgi:cinnamyl-alcohol dehydrogenase